MRAKDFLSTYILFEPTQRLFEVAMNPSNLKKLASAIPGVKVGMEFEMVVPGVDEGDAPEPEADYGMDEGVSDIEGICDFFYRGHDNTRRTINQLRQELNEMFRDWQATKVGELWEEEGEKYFAKWARENVSDDEVAEYLEKDEDLFGETVPTKEDWDKFIEENFKKETDYYARAMEEFSDEKIQEDDLDESEFLDSIGINEMSDVENAVQTDITWPYYITISPADSIENVGEDFSQAIGKTVYTSDSYHSARRSPNAYSLEPDGSISSGSGEAGLEFISPPMTVEEMIEDLKKVKKWADDRGAYTNYSTGLHINVSVPNYKRDNLDYVKLAVLLGDKYVLDQFGRLSNSYAESAISVIKSRARDNEKVDRLLDQLKNNVEKIASKILHNGVTDKYTSINTKNGYVEFRSAGGDWLDKNFDKIENTLSRFIVALDAALDPNKYKKEYQKQLYKVLKPKDPKSDMSMFARFMSGELTRNQYANLIEKQRKERFVTQGIRILRPDEVDENDWEITFNNGKKDETIYIANTEKINDEQAAYDAAKKFKPNWFKPDNVEYVTVKPFKFGEEFDDLIYYDLEYGPKYVSVVAKSEEEAKEIARMMDPDFFSAYPNRKIRVYHLEDTMSKRQLAPYLERQKVKIEQGKQWLARPKIWRAVGRSNYSGRYYIAAITREDAINVVKQLDPDMLESDSFDIYVSDESPTADTYEAYKNAQEDLITRRNEEQERLRREQETEVDTSNLKMYRVSNLNGFKYIVAENGAEAAELATKLEPEKFPNVENLTVQDQSGLTTTSNEALIRGMYLSQQQTLDSNRDTSRGQVTNKMYTVARGNLRGSVFVVAPNELEATRIASLIHPGFNGVSLTATEYTYATSMDINRILQQQNTALARVTSNEQYYLVRNNDTGREVRLYAGSEQNARGRAIRNDPHNFTLGSDITVTPLRALPPQITGSFGQARPAFNEPTRISNLESYRVTNRDTGESRYFSGTDVQSAITRAREEYPAMFPQGANVTAYPARP